MNAHRLHGEFMGTLQGVLAWDIPDELREKLELKLDELRKIVISPFPVDVNTKRCMTCNALIRHDELFCHDCSIKKF